jgi:SAM-dependent methyltransferase
MASSASAITNARLGFCKRKPGLGDIYREWYQLQRNHLASVDGAILELGSGAGFLKAVIPSVITSDVVLCEGVDLCLDALDVGLRFEERLSNLLMVNVFHHICDSLAFLHSASSALLPGGRLIMIEPWLNRWSKLCYQLVGHEPVDPDQAGWTFSSDNPLLDSNQAQAWIVFHRDNPLFHKTFPNLRVVVIQPIMPFSYLLTGGHSTPVGFSSGFVKFCRSLERGYLDRRIGMFALIVVEKVR